MAEIHIPDSIPVRYKSRSRGATLLFGALFAVGLAAFVITLGRDPLQAWRAYLVNWLYFTSIAMGAVMVVVAATVTKARWNWSVKRVGLAFAAFLPLSFLLFLPLLGIMEWFFPWVEYMETDPVVQNKEAWLNLPFLTIRNVLGLLVLFGLALYFVYTTLRPDLGLVEGEEGSEEPSRVKWRERLTKNWIGQEQEEVRSHRRLAVLAPVVALLFAVIFSNVSYDWIMSLEPHWFSTLFGGWFFMGAFWGGAALTALATIWLKRSDEVLDEHMGPQQLHDLGKLCFAFCVFWAYLFWSQYLVIWYGKLPWEQAWIVHRSDETWGGLSALVVILCFIVPFMGLIGRTPKLKPKVLGTFTAVILVGLWLERYVMVVPSVFEGGPILTIWEPLIGLMFLGLFLASFRWFLRTFPIIQIWQPLVDPEMVEAEWNEVRPGIIERPMVSSERPEDEAHRETPGGRRE
ncbi:MAG: hypothetical protein R3223_03285 [Longimicrobiales bacterium]|nr:hypothetical protein [Longimicrobiales bacterium]